LVGAEAEEWSQFIGLMFANFISLMEEDLDTLCWSKNPRKIEIPYASLKTQNREISQQKWDTNFWPNLISKGDKKWWWSLIWKISAPLKCKITLWLPLNNKLLTWDNRLKRGWNGPNRCPLCKSHEQSI